MAVSNFPMLLLLGLSIASIVFNTSIYSMIESWTGPLDVPRMDVPRMDVPTQREDSNTADDGIDWSDSIFHHDVGKWDTEPVVMESHKLLFFTIPKNACTSFKTLFRRMMGYSDWSTKAPYDPKHNGLRYLGHYSRAEQRTMMTSSNWTRAIFVRDPLERALSAFLDKGHRDSGGPVAGSHIKKKCCDLNGRVGEKKPPPTAPEICGKFPIYPFWNPMNASNFPFETFVDKIMEDCRDDHWRPQRERIKESNWKFINFIGRFEHKLQDTHALLKQIGAFEEFGRSGWGTSGNNSIFETSHKFQTGSADKMKEYYTPSLQERVVQYYRDDYEFEVFNFTIPPNTYG